MEIHWKIGHPPRGTAIPLVTQTLSLTTVQDADDAPHAFSSDNHPSLHNTVPALEKLHATWNKKIENAKHGEFWDALKEAAKKVSEYYEKSADTDAYTVAMRTFEIEFY